MRFVRTAQCCTEPSDGCTEDRTKDDQRNGLPERQTKLVAKEAGGKAGQIHGAGGPEKEHGELGVPWDWFAVFWKLAIDGLGLNAQLPVQGGLDVPQLAQDACVLFDGHAVVFHHVISRPVRLGIDGRGSQLRILMEAFGGILGGLGRLLLAILIRSFLGLLGLLPVTRRLS